MCRIAVVAPALTDLIGDRANRLTASREMPMIR
jgi:hypothetical protein